MTDRLAGSADDTPPATAECIHLKQDTVSVHRWKRCLPMLQVHQALRLFDIALFQSCAEFHMQEKVARLKDK